MLTKRSRFYLDMMQDNRRKFEFGGEPSDEDLIDFVIKEEGFLDRPRDIGDGKITLGSGLTDPRWHALYKKRGNKWSAADNREAVRQELQTRRKWAETNVPNWDMLPDSAQKALLSYKYNYDFNEKNSPKLYEALTNKDFSAAAKQIDATSKDPKFVEGLKQRRMREQEWFMRDFSNPIKPNVSTKTSLDYKETPEIPINTRTYNPYVMRMELSRPIRNKVMIPDRNRYVAATYGDGDYYTQQRALQTLRNIGLATNFMRRLSNNLYSLRKPFYK